MAYSGSTGERKGAQRARRHFSPFLPGARIRFQPVEAGFRSRIGRAGPANTHDALARHGSEPLAWTLQRGRMVSRRASLDQLVHGIRQTDSRARALQQAAHEPHHRRSNPRGRSGDTPSRPLKWNGYGGHHERRSGRPLYIVHRDFYGAYFPDRQAGRSPARPIPSCSWHAGADHHGLARTHLPDRVARLQIQLFMGPGWFSGGSDLLPFPSCPEDRAPNRAPSGHVQRHVFRNSGHAHRPQGSHIKCPHYSRTVGSRYLVQILLLLARLFPRRSVSKGRFASCSH